MFFNKQKFKTGDLVIVDADGVDIGPKSLKNDVSIGQIVTYMKREIYRVKILDGPLKNQVLDIHESRLIPKSGDVVVRWPNNMPEISDEDIELLNKIKDIYCIDEDKNNLSALIIKLQYYKSIKDIDAYDADHI